MSEWMMLDRCKSEELLADLRIKQSALAESLSTSIATYKQTSSYENSVLGLPCMQEH